MVDRKTLRDELRKLLEEETGEARAELPDAMRVREELGLDSVDLISLVMHVECQFRVRLTGEELAQICCIGDLLDLIQAKMAGNQSVAA